MKENSIIKNEHLRILVTALIFGGVWGLFEITIGTILHFQALETIGSFFIGSTSIMLPIAYFIMACSYKQTGKYRTIIYTGLIASAIKLSTLIVFANPSFFQSIMPYKLAEMKIINPAISIVFESLITCGVMAVVKPNEVLSAKSFIVVVISNLLWTSAFMGWSALLATTGRVKLGKGAMFLLAENSKGVLELTANLDRITGFLISSNFIGSFYVAIIGSIAYGIKYLLVKYNKTVSSEKVEALTFNKISASICAAVIPTVAVIATVFLAPFAYAVQNL